MPLLCLLILFASPAVFTLFLMLVLFVALLEFNRMGLEREHLAEQVLMAGAGSAVVPLLYFEQAGFLLPQ